MWNAETYRLANEEQIPSPALIYYPAIIRENVQRAIDMAGGAARLWPHVKTHKMAELIRMQREMGIDRFKCSTITELKMVARCGAKHAILAYPLIGPNVEMFLDAVREFPETHMYALADSQYGLQLLDDACARRGMRVDWLCDVNLGMDRTGVRSDELAQFCLSAQKFGNVHFVGFHCYDGHNHQSCVDERASAVEEQMAPVARAKRALAENGIKTSVVISGGSPSMPCHAQRGEDYLSPGTVFVWDYNYAKDYPDLPFLPGAALLARVVSHPAPGVFTIDLGYKAISSDTEGLRGHLMDHPHAQPMFQSEEHWTWRMQDGHEPERPAIGTVLYVIPAHICPTTALYDSVYIAKDQRAEEKWRVAARNRDSTAE